MTDKEANMKKAIESLCPADRAFNIRMQTYLRFTTGVTTLVLVFFSNIAVLCVSGSMLARLCAVLSCSMIVAALTAMSGVARAKREMLEAEKFAYVRLVEQEGILYLMTSTAVCLGIIAVSLLIVR